MVGNLGFEPKEKQGLSLPRIPFRQSPISHFASPQAASPLSFRFSFGDKTGNTNANIPKVSVSKITSNSLFRFWAPIVKPLASYLVWDLNPYSKSKRIASSPIRRTRYIEGMGYTHPIGLPEPLLISA